MYEDLLGVRFKVHGRNKKEGFDCYGLAIEVLRRNGIILKDVFYDNLDVVRDRREEEVLGLFGGNGLVAFALEAFPFERRVVAQRTGGGVYAV